MFQHTAARRRLAPVRRFRRADYRGFNTQPPEGGWFLGYPTLTVGHQFQHTAARRRLAKAQLVDLFAQAVSTHSRPKAAGDAVTVIRCVFKGFNTQPPEGGWENK